MWPNDRTLMFFMFQIVCSEWWGGPVHDHLHVETESAEIVLEAGTETGRGRETENAGQEAGIKTGY